MKSIEFKSGGTYERLKLCAYYVQRMCVSRRIRRIAANVVIAALRMRYGRPMSPASSGPAAVETLRMQGFVRLRRLLTPQQCADMLAYLRPHSMVATRGNGARFDLSSVPADTCVADYSLQTVVHCPHVMELANHPEVIAMAARYLGYTPTITLLSMRWSFADSETDLDIQGYHRDTEFGSIKLLVYITDVDEGSGPHRYVAGSHGSRMPIRMHRYSDCEVNLRHGGSIGILGPAGTAFLIDTRGIHKGTHPTRSARLLLGIQYSLLPCLNYRYTPVEYHGSARLDAYMNRLMLKLGRPLPAHRAERKNMAALAE